MTSASRFFNRIAQHKFFGPRPELKKYSSSWWVDKTIVCTVFAITGSTTAFAVRPLISKRLKLDGSMKDGPWSYRIVSIVIMMPVYSALLVTVGTIFGRHHYFKKFAANMWTRMFRIKPAK